jgi:hypothetical protein
VRCPPIPIIGALPPFTGTGGRTPCHPIRSFALVNATRQNSDIKPQQPSRRRPCVVWSNLPPRGRRHMPHEVAATLRFSTATVVIRRGAWPRARSRLVPETPAVAADARIGSVRTLVIVVVITSRDTG